MASSGLNSSLIVGEFYNRLENIYDGSWVSPICWKTNSTAQFENYRFTDQVPALSKWTGQRKPSEITSKGIIVANDTYTNELRVSTDDIRRDRTGQIMTRVSELAGRVPELIESNVATLITNGTGTTSGSAYDGATFFSASHSEGSSGTQTNLLTSTEVAQLDVGTAAAPTEAEASQAVLNATMKFFGFLDDKGSPMNMRARSFMILCPINLAGALLAGVYNPTVIGAGGAVSTNPIVNTPYKYSVIPTPRLTTTTVFYIFRTDGDTKPFILQEEEGVTMDVLAEGSEYEAMNLAHFYGVRWTGGFGYGQWQHALHCTLS